MAQIQRAAKEIHSAVSGTQTPKVERVFRVICTTQVFFFFFLFLILQIIAHTVWGAAISGEKV